MIKYIFRQNKDYSRFNIIKQFTKDLKLKNGESMQVMARIRYRQELQKATLHQFESGLYVYFDQPQSAITEGQFVAWNIEDELVGSGVIS